MSGWHIVSGHNVPGRVDPGRIVSGHHVPPPNSAQSSLTNFKLAFPQLGCEKEKKVDRKCQIKPSSIGEDTIEFITLKRMPNKKMLLLNPKYPFKTQMK